MTDSTQPNNGYRVVSLFSGCGGLDLGFRGGFTSLGRRYGRHGFEIVWAGDINPYAVATYRRNIDEDAEVGNIWGQLDQLPQRPDVLIGGFPCQDISVNGKRKGVNGTRSGLYRAMVVAVEQTKPKIFVAENVKGLLMRYNEAALETVLSDFAALEYNVSYRLYQAADYGVPQTRERVFIVGTSRGVKSFCPPEAAVSREEWVTAQQAIDDLAGLPEDPEWNHIWSRANHSPEQGSRRLRADRPGYTVRAECHGNIQFHYALPRRISMREAARIQSFPDDFIFEAKLRETERMIGNAVPPAMGWHIAQAVKSALIGGRVAETGLAKESSSARARRPSLATS
jgi:DNA (cytosine-5)-methyltransferase 1